MKTHMKVLVLALAVVASGAAAQTTPAASPASSTPAPPANTPPRRPVVEVMPLTSTAWKDGAAIPAKYAQPGRDVSPALAWSNVPETAESFVLIAHDLDAITPMGTDSFLHWMVWNIPKAARGFAEGQREGGQMPDGSRQISGSGPYYRGPAAPESGPAHHYVFELYAVSVPAIDVPAVGKQPAEAEAAVRAAMEGKIVGKGVFTGLFRR